MTSRATCLSASAGSEKAWRRGGGRAAAPPAAGDGATLPGQRAGTLALDCLLPGPPSVTVSSHGHRRLAPPQDRGPGHLPRPRPLCPRGSLSPELAARAAAVRGADPARAPPSSSPVPGPQGLLRGCRPTRTCHSPRSPAPGPCRERRPPPAPPPSPHSAVLTSAKLELPWCRQQRAPRPRVSRATVAFDCYCGNRR